jgi:L,D-transpeptidase catalytic domain
MKVISLLFVFFIIFSLPKETFAEDGEQVFNIVHSTQLDPKIVKLALSAYRYAALHTHLNKNILTIVDYSQPSAVKRLYVIDLKTDQLLMKIWVAHGRNTGNLTSIHFSNQPQSKQSSLGVFVTEGVYIGHHGRSMVLQGIEKNINDNARSRRLVVHAAPYVSEAFLQATGRLGRSFGCLAVNSADLERLIRLTENGSVIFSYAPQEDHDPFL